MNLEMLNPYDKVPYCRECHYKPNGDHVDIVLTEGKPAVACCPHCYEKLGTIQVSKLDDNGVEKRVDGVVLGDENTPRSYAIRVFDSPLGRIRLNLSTDSTYCYSATVNDKPDIKLKSWIDEGFQPAKNGPVYEFIQFVVSDVQKFPCLEPEIELEGVYAA
jgi:hypothetical protein